MKTEYFTQKTAYGAALNASSQAQQTSNTALAQQYEMQANAIKDRMDFLVGSILSDETGTLNRQDTIRKWLGHFDRVDADFYVARNFFNHGRPSSADSVLQLIPTKFIINTERTQEVAAMRQLVALLAGKDVFALNETTITALETFAESEFSPSSDWARSILTYYGNWFQPSYKLPTIGERSRQESSVHFDSPLYVYPNPANHLLNVQLRDILGPLEIELVNPLGSIVAVKKLAPGEKTAVFNTEDLPSGIYLVKAKQKGGKTLIQKLVVNH